MDCISIKPPSIQRAGDACFDEIQKLFAQSPTAEISDESLASLHFLYGKNFGKALEVVDAGGIVCFVGETSGRRVYKVPGRKPTDQYIVFPSHYCSCQSFLYDVVGRGDAASCKHQLAARLSTVINRATAITVPELTIATMLLEHCS